MRSCLCCSLYQTCKWVAGYAFVSACLGILSIVYSIASGETKGPGMRAFEVIMGLVMLTVAVALVFGLKRKDRRLLLIWIVVEATVTAIVIAALIYIIYVYASSSSMARDLDAYDHDEELWELKTILVDAHRILLLRIILMSIHVFLEIICLDAIRSYRSVLEQEEQAQSFPVTYHIPVADNKVDHGLV
ncbi:hypothetical protein BV898_14711 [Hypsibius exemplaris]|uniref:Uncharacterized protein n=1 Tax=Hypsibius exemplaris TaxID=2072580 RepID=A0A9X6NGE9_HYPEX|nr:hypothetical protein BV898_14711 [Hypsibius exemplaris]